MQKGCNQNPDLIFSKKVIHLRKKYGYSKKEMAHILGIGIASLNKVENGEIPPRMTVDVLFRIYDHFGVSPKEMFTADT